MRNDGRDDGDPSFWVRFGLALLFLYVWSIGLAGWYLGPGWWKWLLDPMLIGGLGSMCYGVLSARR